MLFNRYVDWYGNIQNASSVRGFNYTGTWLCFQFPRPKSKDPSQEKKINVYCTKPVFKEKMSVNVLNTKPTHYIIYRHENGPKAETHPHRITFQHSPPGRVTGWCHTVWAIQASYLILVDEEKHDGQNLQEEDEQEQNEELWRHKGKRRRRLSNWRHHLPGRNKKKTVALVSMKNKLRRKKRTWDTTVRRD